ncbi:hypothetical protein [Methylobacterium sp. Gmos1]
MGLPAFDISAFEYAQSAVTSKPRAATTMFLAQEFKSSASIEELREQVRASTDAPIEDYISWRADVLRGISEMHALLQDACRSQPLELLRSLSGHLADQLKEVEAGRTAFAELDDESIRRALPMAEQASQISIDTGRFVRREIRRVERMAKARADTYEKLLARIREAKARLDGFVESQALAPVSLPEEHGKADYLQNALHRPADVEGVRERTARRLKQFPKTAAYLAR